ncbi:hypothetical protein EZJ49_11130 [Bdellovibrio bacteriovorus]|uniref:hypothetical protein n=1 Tax=Bdellovibrio bacteriovorus TaxID=959 RepID=UPI0021CF5DEB|nr:hypothetical protein [Bdellovibrio bacteriovorus]UXR63628.1 hypothetical protein EZJ49_11130 [Bdellovibrio bacteriovorus]
MKRLLIPTLIFIAGCSSQPKATPEEVEANLPKASPPRGGTTTTYGGHAAPNAIELTPAKEALPVIEGKRCDTPLGTIPDGGKATGYLQAVVPADDICISDTITCKDGVWSGQAIHPTCKKEKSK